MFFYRIVVKQDQGTVEAYIQVGTPPEPGAGGAITTYQNIDIYQTVRSI